MDVKGVGAEDLLANSSGSAEGVGGGNDDVEGHDCEAHKRNKVMMSCGVGGSEQRPLTLDLTDEDYLAKPK